MKLKSKKTTVVDLTPDQVTEIIRQHFKLKGLKVDSVSYNIGREYESHLDQSGTDCLKNITVTRIEEENIEL